MNVRSEFYIGGEWVKADGTDTLDVIDSSTEQVIGSVPAGTATDIDRAVTAARAAFDGWAELSADQRGKYLGAIAAGLGERQEEIALLIAAEVGMSLTLSRIIQAGLPINSFMTAAKLAETFEFESADANSTFVREPVGVVGAITPWNYPLHQIAAKVAYALAAGCTVVLKPSEVAPLNAFVLAEVIDAVGLPAGVFNLVTGLGPVVGEALAVHPEVDMMSFTGSTAAGKRVSELASASVKRVALELGGKSPNVVLDDAPLDKAIPDALGKAFLNSGQTCSALTRLLVPREKLAEVEALAKTAAEGFTVGDPRESTTMLGPLVSERQRERVRGYINKGIDEGAKLVTGGAEAPDGLETGYFVRPTVFSEVTPEMTIHREEIFGPVLSIEPYDDEDDAIRIANDTVYGLAGGVWSADPARAKRVARRIRAGQIEINGGAFNPNAPFGGFKQSGNGREYGSFGLEEFLEVKSLQS
jgi:acyl-CoA reductase-like NAD-dependent aldehyde dehydrogenase